MPIIKNIRGGSHAWSEEDRINLCTQLIKAGYKAQIKHMDVPGNTKKKKEYVVEYEE